MSKKFEYPIERFIYNDEYTNEDLSILELDSNKLQDIVNLEKIKEQEDIENKEEIIIIVNDEKKEDEEILIIKEE